MNDHLRRAAEIARDLVRQAGVLVAEMQDGVEVRDKGGSLGPVTDADLAAEKILLAGIRAAFPDDAILSEESHAEVDVAARRIWCIDPIDGTREYAKGLGEYACQAGLLIDGEPAAGALGIPAEGRVFWGWRGGGVFLDDQPIEMQTIESIGDAIAIHSRSHAEGTQELLTRLGVARSIAVGGCGYKISRLLLGDAHLYVHARRGTTWWDTVAPAALVLASNGHAGDARGQPLDYRTDIRHLHGLLFTAPGLGPQAATRLAKA